MIKITKKLFPLIFIVWFQNDAQTITEKIQQFSNTTKAKVSFDSNSSSVSFIKFNVSSPYSAKGNSVTDKSLNFISQSGLFNNLEQKDFKINEVKTDIYGNKHVTLLQMHHSIPVFDGKLKFHYNTENKITSINGNIQPNIKINTNASINENSAKNIAIKYLTEQNINTSGAEISVHKSELLIYPKGKISGHFEANYLTYYIELRNNVDVREYLFVDAYSGEIIEQFTGMPHAINRIVYEENTSNIVWQEGDALPGALTIWQQNEVNASAHTYNFFNNAFGFVSYDGADAQMVTINNRTGLNCPNATWNGTSANYCDGTASDDVIAHEWGHAYTEFTNNLIYAWQSGAINEAYSDIWGETIDLLNNYEDAGEDLSLRTGCNSSLRWRMGEDATAFGAPIRDLWDPTCRNDPGKVTDGQYFCNATDQGGVHSNSGVVNHAYALLVDGGTYNTYTINSLDFTKAAHIFWRAQSQYLTATSDFSNLADALEMSAQDLLGINLKALSTESAPTGLSGEIITAADVQTVMDVILAVEMRINPDTCNFQPLLTTSPEPCAASSTNPIFSVDWETLTNGWTVTELPENPSTWEDRNWEIVSNLPKNRSGKAFFATDPINGDCQTDLQNGILRLQSPVITIPNYATGTTEMFFNHNIATEENWDGANIKYSLNGGTWELLPASAFTSNPYNGQLNAASAGNDNPMQSQEAFTGSDGGSVQGSWGTSIIDLSTIGVIENSTIQFRFEMGTDGCNGRVGWYIDEIAIYNCNFALSVSDFDNLSDIIKIYPNPSNGIFNIKKQNQINLTKANIYDIDGRLIRIVDLRNINISAKINLSDVSSGLYFIEINSNNNKHVFKVFKN